MLWFSDWLHVKPKQSSEMLTKGACLLSYKWIEKPHDQLEYENTRPSCINHNHKSHVKMVDQIRGKYLWDFYGLSVCVLK